MPEVTLRHEIDCDVDTYWAKIFFDEKFNEALFVEDLGFKRTLEELKEDDAKITRRVYVEPPTGNLPGPLKKVVGDKLGYTEVGTLDRTTKKYSFKATPSTMAEKTKIFGDLWCEAKGDKKCVRVVKMTVEVKVMLVGGMVEDRIVADLRTSYDKGAVFTNNWIKKHGI